MISFKIRALTIALDISPLDIIRLDVLESYVKLLRTIRRLCKRIDIPIWSFRIALQPISLRSLGKGNLALKMMKSVHSLCERSGFNYISVPFVIPTEDLKLTTTLLNVLDHLIRYSNVFLSFNIKEYDIVDVPLISNFYVSLLNYLCEKNALMTQARISLVLKGPLMTPYFPSASSLNDESSVMASLLYLRYISSLLRNGISLSSALLSASDYVDKILSDISQNSGIANAGIDLSLSPWMEESIYDVIKAYHDVDFPYMYTLYSINKELELASMKTRSIGFNEVMLPLAEDNWLKDLTSRGILRIRDFVSLSVICVAGVDMIPLPNFRQDELEAIISDILTLSLIKRRVVGVRLIKTKLNPGDTLSLPLFGDTPIPYL